MMDHIPINGKSHRSKWMIEWEYDGGYDGGFIHILW